MVGAYHKRPNLEKFQHQSNYSNIINHFLQKEFTSLDKYINKWLRHVGLLVTVEGQDLTANCEGGNKSENHFVRTLVKTSKGKDQHWMLNLQGNICVVLKSVALWLQEKQSGNFIVEKLDIWTGWSKSAHTNEGQMLCLYLGCSQKDCQCQVPARMDHWTKL